MQHRNACRKRQPALGLSSPPSSSLTCFFWTRPGSAARLCNRTNRHLPDSPIPATFQCHTPSASRSQGNKKRLIFVGKDQGQTRLNYRRLFEKNFLRRSTSTITPSHQGLHAALQPSQAHKLPLKPVHPQSQTRKKTGIFQGTLPANPARQPKQRNQPTSHDRFEPRRRQLQPDRRQ